MRVAIIGAGICGLYLARKLAERNEEVTVFEKRGFIGKEACSGLFSERILEFIPESEDLVQNQIREVLIHFPRKTLQVRFSKKFLVMSHFKLDNLVADLAKKAGVKIILNSPINSIPAEFDRIIGCDGALSFARKSLGLAEPKFSLGIQGFILKEDNTDYVEAWPTETGFLWKIPRVKEIEYGIMEKPKEARRIFDNFLKKNNISLERMSSTLIPQGFIVPSNSKITLCGDSSGLTKPWSGGGVVWSIIAADLLLKNFPDFLKYRKSANKLFFPKIIFSKIIKKAVYFLGFNLPFILPKRYNIESDFLIQ